MKKLLLTLTLNLVLLSTVNAQWDGSTSSSGTIHRVGKIGINTTTPEGFLHIRTAHTTNAYNTILDGNSLSFLSNNTTSYINKRDNGRLMFRYGTGYTEAMTLFNGNLGIGEVTPTSRLHVKYSSNTTTPLATFEGSSNDTPQVIIKNSGGSGEGLLIESGGTGPSNALQVSRFNGTSLMNVKGNGKVGIGTDNPFSKLQVEGRVSAGYWGVLQMDWTYDTNWGGHSNKWAGYIGFNAYRNNNDTKDNYYGRNKYTNKGVFEGSNYGFRWLYRNRINNDSESQHQLSELMRLDNNGNLGIGTANPGVWKLAVNGNVRAKEIKVETGWSDFVFYDDYKLPTLQEVETHIKEKGHLKDIPSAKEVEENGIFLGDMNAKLLQKIEELTLYTIEQEKELNTSKIEAQKSKNNIKELEHKNASLEARLSKLESLIETLKN